MALTTPGYKEQYILTTTGQTLSFPYRFLLDTDLIVTRTDQQVIPQDTELTLSSDYTVSGAGAELGGSITLEVASADVGDVITVERCPPCTQLIRFFYNTRFPSRVNEKGFDKAMMLICKLLGDIYGENATVIRLPATEFGTNNILPIKKDRVGDGVNGTIAGFDPITGEFIALAPGSLDLGLLLLTDSSLGGATPSNVNGATQKAIKCYVDMITNAIINGVGLNPDGTFPSQAGKNFISTSTDVLDAICKLDEALQCAWDGAIDLNNRVLNLDSRVTDLENSPAAGAFDQGTPSGSTTRTWTLTKPAGTKWLSVSIFSVIQGQSNGSAKFVSATCDLGIGQQVGTFLPGQSIPIVIADSLAQEAFHYVPLNYVIVPVDQQTDTINVTLVVQGNNGSYKGYMEGKYG
jgi:hypothetical protein